MLEDKGKEGWTLLLHKRQFGLSGSTLKYIALGIMLIDHIGAIILEKLASHLYGGPIFILRPYDMEGISNTVLFIICLDVIFRFIGRLAFPIFAFLLIEGFLRTKNIKKYGLRLFLFAIISEIPFNLALTGKVFCTDFQNIFFTLLISLIIMEIFSKVEEKENWNIILKLLIYTIVLFLGMLFADYLKTDYGSIGIFCIMMLYIFRKNKILQIIAGCISFLWEITAPFAFIPISFYNGNRGKQCKYLFYIFYPAHLSVLYGIAYFLGITSFSLY